MRVEMKSSVIHDEHFFWLHIVSFQPCAEPLQQPVRLHRRMDEQQRCGDPPKIISFSLSSSHTYPCSSSSFCYHGQQVGLTSPF